MAAPPIIVIWFVAGELTAPASDAMGAAARSALGTGTEVRLIEPAGASAPPPPLGPNAGFVRVEWGAPNPERAHLSSYWPGPGRWIEREIAFAPTDPVEERGRTLGFLIASMAVDAEAIEDATSSPELPSSSPRPQRSRAPESLQSIPGVRQPLPRAPTLSLSAGAEAAAAGAGTGYGAWIGGSHAVVGAWLWAGGSARARFGSLPEAQATTRFLAVGAELTWLAYRPSRQSWLGVRTGLFVSRLTVTHFSDDDLVPDEQGRWLPGLELAAHGELAFTPAAGLFADLGAELLAGSTDLWVRHRLVAVWPKAGALLRLGVQTRF